MGLGSRGWPCLGRGRGQGWPPRDGGARGRIGGGAHAALERAAGASTTRSSSPRPIPLLASGWLSATRTQVHHHPGLIVGGWVSSCVCVMVLCSRRAHVMGCPPPSAGAARRAHVLALRLGDVHAPPLPPRARRGCLRDAGLHDAALLRDRGESSVVLVVALLPSARGRGGAGPRRRLPPARWRRGARARRISREERDARSASRSRRCANGRRLSNHRLCSRRGGVY